MNGPPTSDGSSTDPIMDEIFEAVQQGLSVLDAARLTAISHMTGLSVQKLIELGGEYDPAAEARRDRPGIPGQGPAPAPGDQA